MKRIHYRAGYKYQLADEYRDRIGIRPSKTIDTEFIRLDTDGQLTIRKGYAWNGADGPTFEWPGRKKTKRPTLVHDAGYQLIRQGHLDKSNRDPFDRLLEQDLIEDGMWKWWAARWYNGVNLGGNAAASPENVRPILTAP